MSQQNPAIPAAQKFRIRSLIWSVYVPSFLLAMGQSIVIPTLPGFAREVLGSTDALIGLAVGARHIGMMGLDVPAGMLASRLGMRKTMILGTAIFAISAFAAAASTNFGWLYAARLLTGASFALWSISRHSFIAVTVPPEARGKALSLFGGVSRAAVVIGPLAGGFAATYVDIRAPFYLQGGVGLATMALVMFSMRGLPEATVRQHRNVIASLADTLTSYKGVFMTAGVVAISLQFIRQAREFIIPVWGENVGLNEAEIGYVVATSSVIDSTMFPVVGYSMDRWGRKSAGVPALLVLAVSMAVLPFADSFAMLMLVGVVAGFGNGLSSGFVLTMGADLAPKGNPAEFIGVWRLISDGGGAAGPNVLGPLAGAFSLATAALVTAGVGVFGAGLLLVGVRETLGRRGESERRRPG